MKTTGSIVIPALAVEQPIGEFFVGVMNSTDLLDISYADIREIERDLDTYLGIQRKISPARRKDLGEYVNTKDAVFPTSVILAVEEGCASWDEKAGTLTLSSTKEVDFDHIAKVLDGQHRLEGLKNLKSGQVFQINVTVFVAADIADQANIFATVNLAQTKVNRSLVYDLYDYAQSRSPQKSAHDITVALDRTTGGPFFERIKRLGTRTSGRAGETLTQATVVTAILELVTATPMIDRDTLMRGKKLRLATSIELRSLPLRNLFIEDQDISIAKLINSYFSSVRSIWPEAWADLSKGNIMPRTNGFRAFMRAFADLYVDMCHGTRVGAIFSSSEFADRLNAVQLTDGDFNTGRYAPGNSGETTLYKDLIRFLGVERVRRPSLADLL